MGSGTLRVYGLIQWLLQSTQSMPHVSKHSGRSHRVKRHHVSPVLSSIERENAKNKDIALLALDVAQALFVSRNSFQRGNLASRTCRDPNGNTMEVHLHYNVLVWMLSGSHEAFALDLYGAIFESVVSGELHPQDIIPSRHLELGSNVYQRIEEIWEIRFSEGERFGRGKITPTFVLF